MVKKTNKSRIENNIEITSDGNTNLKGDLVGGNKVSTHVNLYVQLDQKKNKNPVKKTRSPQTKRGFISLKDYFVLLAGMMFILSGTLLFLGFVTINAIIILTSGAELSGSAGNNSAASTLSKEVVQSESQETVLTLTSPACDATVEILNDANEVILSILISADSSQTFSLPAGSYTYDVKYHCASGIAGAAGTFPIDYSKSFYLTNNSDVRVSSPESFKINFPFLPDFSLDQFIGLILVIIGIGFVFYILYKKTGERMMPN